jgi:hypothetical protein
MTGVHIDIDIDSDTDPDSMMRECNDTSAGVLPPPSLL